MTVSISYFGSRGDDEDNVPLKQAIAIVEKALKNGQVVIEITKKGTRFRQRYLQKASEVRPKSKLTIGSPVRGG